MGIAPVLVLEMRLGAWPGYERIVLKLPKCNKMTLIPYKFHLIFASKGVLSYPDAENVSSSDIFMHLHDGGFRAACDEDS